MSREISGGGYLISIVKGEVAIYFEQGNGGGAI